MATAAVDEIAGNCLAVRVRLLGRAVTSLYDHALEEHGVSIAQINLLNARVPALGGAGGGVLVDNIVGTAADGTIAALDARDAIDAGDIAEALCLRALLRDTGDTAVAAEATTTDAGGKQ